MGIPMKTLNGIHHVTAICSDAQRNVDFYAGVLGMRLVKKTVNFDDPNSYHLYYGDRGGSPGTLLTFFAWPRAAKGRIGASEPIAVSFQAPKGSMDWWAERLRTHEHRYQHAGRLGVLDPDGMCVELVEGNDGGDEKSIERIHGVTLNLQDVERSSALFAEELGFSRVNEGRYRVGQGRDAGYVDVQAGSGGSGMMGAGTIHHVAFRTEDDATQEEWQRHVARLGLHVSPVMDRKYFHSIYFRERSGVLFEIATDPPGMTVDEAVEHLGEELMLPARYEAARKQVEAILTPLAVPAYKESVEARI
jgi:glyoxalase family protein